MSPQYTLLEQKLEQLSEFTSRILEGKPVEDRELRVLFYEIIEHDDHLRDEEYSQRLGEYHINPEDMNEAIVELRTYNLQLREGVKITRKDLKGNMVQLSTGRKRELKLDIKVRHQYIESFARDLDSMIRAHNGELSNVA